MLYCERVAYNQYPNLNFSPIDPVRFSWGHIHFPEQSLTPPASPVRQRVPELPLCSPFSCTVKFIVHTILNTKKNLHLYVLKFCVLVVFMKWYREEQRNSFPCLNAPRSEGF